MIIIPLINKTNIDNASAPGMQLVSKYRMGGLVFVMHDNTIHEGKIVRIDGSLQFDGPNILYTLELPDAKGNVQLPEEFCFESKEALKGSL